MGILILTFVSALAIIAMAARSNVNIQSSCSELQKCLPELSSLERLQLTYLAENETKYDELCQSKNTFFDCYDMNSRSCNINSLKEAKQSTKQIQKNICSEQDDARKNKENSARNANSNCYNAVKCFKQLFKKDNVAVGLFDMLTDKDKKHCVAPEEYKTCMNYRIECEMKAVNNWLDLTKRTYQLYCMGHYPNGTEHLSRVLNEGCNVAKCWKDLLTIDQAEVKRFNSLNKQSQEDICNKTRPVNDCFQQFEADCEIIPEESIKKSRHNVETLLCSEEAISEKKKRVMYLNNVAKLRNVIDEMPSGYLQHLSNNAEYNKIC
ncbi:hypothetical protein Btru_074127, partial [Bulinus truncatus]